jgi:hypothetical protein
MDQGRECRLRPEYAEAYEEIPAGRWMPAHELAAAIVRRVTAARRLGAHGRTMDPKHFEFRGGSPIHRERATRTRRGEPSNSS